MAIGLSRAAVVLLALASRMPLGAEAPLIPVPPEQHSRVIIVQNPNATSAYEPRPEVLRSMVNEALTNLTLKPNLVAAWRSLVATQDVVGLKVYSGPGSRSGTRPAVVAAVIEGLLKAGLPPTNIIIWDKRKEDLVQAGYRDLARRYGVQLEASVAAGYNGKVFYEAALVGQLVDGDHEFGRTDETAGRKSFVTKLLTGRITKIINISPLLNHYRAGVTGNLYSLAFGSVDNTRRFEFDRIRFEQSVLEIYAMPEVGDRVVLNVVDALICQYEGEHLSLLQYATPLNELRFSTDPVALDVLSVLELARQRQTNSRSLSITNLLDLYEKASIMELGVSDPRNIRIERMR